MTKCDFCGADPEEDFYFTLNHKRICPQQLKALEDERDRYRKALEDISTLAIEFSDCDPDGCPAGSLQRTAVRALREQAK